MPHEVRSAGRSAWTAAAWHSACTNSSQRRPHQRFSSVGVPTSSMTAVRSRQPAGSSSGARHRQAKSHFKNPARRGGHVMCDRIGCTHFPKLSEMDFSGARRPPSRRRFLKGAAAVSTISMGMGSAGTAHAGAPVKSTHGTGFCNLNIFLAHSLQIREGRRARARVHQHADLRRAGDLPRHGPGRCRPDALHQLHRAATTRARRSRSSPAAASRAAPSSPGPASTRPRSSRARRSAPSRSIRWRCMPYDYLKKHGVTFKDVKVRYMGNTPEAVEAFKAGAHRLDLHHRALCLGAGERRQGRGHAVGRHRHLRQGLHRLRAGRARQPDQGQSRRG